MLVDDFNVSVTGSEAEIYSGVAMNGAGDFVVVWNEISNNVQAFLARAYDATAPLSDPFQLNTLPVSGDIQGLPDVVLDDQGQAFTAWVSGTTRETCAVVYRSFDIHRPVWLPVEEFSDPPVTGVRYQRPMVDMNERGDKIVV